MNLAKIERNGHNIKLRLFKKLAEIEQGHPGSILSVFDIVNYIYQSKQIDLKDL